MDDLIDAFAVSQVTVQPNSTAAEHPHFSLYKAKKFVSSQEERRQKFLEAQKKKRYDYASHARELATSEWGREDEFEEEVDDDDMDYDETVRKPPRSYSNQLMLSEWLVEVPSDLDKEWYMMLCPVGKRCLVVASRGKTKVYTKSGYMIDSFISQVPGGNIADVGSRRNVYSILDCVYDELNKTFYILDVMCWNSHPCYDSETEFRFYWIHSKLDETPDVQVVSKRHPYKFLPLPYYTCDIESISKVLWSPIPFPSKLDGLLFYHKRTHYISGTTPLVGWLKAYMAPEILSVEVPNSLCSDKPSSYVCMQQHCPEAFQKNAERKMADEKQMQFEDDS